MRSFYTILVLFISLNGHSQEVCNNAIDDDNDGLIDLNDPDCQCGLGLHVLPSYAIPNPNFDNSSCCPINPPTIDWNNLTHTMDCVDDWHCSAQINHYNSLERAFYINSCNTCISWSHPNNAGVNSNLPSQCFNINQENGMLGLTFGSQLPVNDYTYEYTASACLNSPLLTTNNYALEIDAYNFNWHQSQNYVVNDTFEIGLFGSASCSNIPLTGYDCAVPGWQTLDTLLTLVEYDSIWHKLRFTFSPNSLINAIAIGEICETIYGQNNQGQPAGQYSNPLLIDSLKLFYSKIYDLQISESGSWCDFPFELNASIDTMGGTWQWYKDSIALIGETDTILDITSLGIGNYTALYTLNEDCQGENINIPPPVYPFAFLFTEPEACKTESIDFIGIAMVTSGNLVSHIHDFGTGDFDSTELTTYAYDTSGIFTTYFTAESDRGCITTDSTQITVHQLPTIDFLVENGCQNDSLNFIDLSIISSGSIAGITWDMGDSFTSYDSLVTHSYQNHGTYPIQLIAESNFGCQDSLSQPISISPIPKVIFTVSDSCENSDIEFQNSSIISNGSIQNYIWHFDDNITANTIHAIHAYATPGNYLPYLTAISDSGCIDSTILDLVIYPKPVSSFLIQQACLSVEVLNTSTISSGLIEDTNWDFGDGTTSSNFNASSQYTTFGTYNINLLSTSDFGCRKDTTILITLTNNFVADFTPKISQVCAGDKVQLNNTSSTHAFGQTINYYWEMSDGQTSTKANPTFVFTNDYPTIDLLFEVSTHSGCFSSISQIEAISVIPLPNAYFSFTPEEPTLTNPSVEFLNQSTFAENYWWNFGDNDHSEKITPSHVYPEISKAYTVTLKAMDINGICSNEYSRTLIVQDEILFFIPNAFTPDDSGKNDIFSPQFISGIDIYHFKLQIFNRWGEIVFESNDPTIGWDGRYASKIVKQDVYIWKIDFEESILDKTHTHTGTVNVLR